MYSIKKINGKESNTGKGVNIATDFNEFKDVLFVKKIIRHKMKRIKSKKHKLGISEIDKISLSCFDNKRCVLFYTLACFHKDSVTSCKKTQKDCDKKEESEKNCDKKDCDKKDCEKTSC